MNNHEKEIIKQLRNGKRVNISEIARQLNIPISTTADKIKKIESKYIVKHSSLLDFKELGYATNEMVAIKVQKDRNLIGEFLKSQSCVNSVYRVNSKYDFLVELVCRDRLELLAWTEQLCMKFDAEVTSFPILKIEEKEKFVP